MRSYRYLAALVAAALLAAVPAQALAYTCTRGGAIISYTTGVTQNFNTGVYAEGVSAILDQTVPYVVFVQTTTFSTAGIWIDSNNTAGSAWMGIYANPAGQRWGRMYYRNSNGTTELDETFPLSPSGSTAHFRIMLDTGGGGTVEFYYNHANIESHLSLFEWEEQPSTVGATAGINNKASMMWGVPADHFAFNYLTYYSQYGSARFTANSPVQNSNSTWFGAVREQLSTPTPRTQLRVWDKNCS